MGWKVRETIFSVFGIVVAMRRSTKILDKVKQYKLSVLLNNAGPRWPNAINLVSEEMSSEIPSKNRLLAYAWFIWLT